MSSNIIAALVMFAAVATRGGPSELPASIAELPLDALPAVRLASNQLLDTVALPAVAVFDRSGRLVGFAEGDGALESALATAEGRSPPLAQVDPDALAHLLAGADAPAIEAIRGRIASRDRTVVFVDLAGMRCPPCERERVALQALDQTDVILLRRLVDPRETTPAGADARVVSPLPGFRVSPVDPASRSEPEDQQ